MKTQTCSKEITITFSNYSLPHQRAALYCEIYQFFLNTATSLCRREIYDTCTTRVYQGISKLDKPITQSVISLTLQVTNFVWKEGIALNLGLSITFCVRRVLKYPEKYSYEPVSIMRSYHVARLAHKSRASVLYNPGISKGFFKFGLNKLLVITELHCDCMQL